MRDRGDIRDQIRECRRKRGLSQEAVARELGIAVKTYRSYETVREPTLARLREIADVLDARLVIELHPERRRRAPPSA